jgi:CHASE2 domain-containing sensor protein
MAKKDAKPAPAASGPKRHDLFLNALLTGVAGAIITRLGGFFDTGVLTEPWKILWFLVPLAIAVVITWVLLRRHRGDKLDWRWFVLLGVYCGIFGVASSSELLVWEREPAHSSSAGNVGRSWFLPVGFGDWRYAIARRKAASRDLAVVLLSDSTHEKRIWKRQRDRRLIDLANTQGARGIAFDVDYSGPPTDVDDRLCSTVERARTRMFVIAAPDLTGADNGMLRPLTPMTGSLACFPVDEQGHAMGYADSDARVRTLPLYWNGDHNAPAFGVRVAAAIQKAMAKPELEVSSMESLRFLPPQAKTLQILEVADLSQLELPTAPLKGYFVIVGERSAVDSFLTPFSKQPEPGAIVHAYAVHSLLNDTYIRRPGSLSSVVMVLVACYALTLFAARRYDARRLAQIAGIITLIIMILSAGAMYLWYVWLDVIYAVVAVWLLLPILLASRRYIEAPQAQPEKAPAKPKAPRQRRAAAKAKG